MLAKNPADKTVQSLVEKVKERLVTAREKEKVNVVTNPLMPAVELMSLNSAELEKWLIVFRDFDVAKEGGLQLSYIFEKLEETPTSFNKSIFLNMDAVDPETGLIECGDFMRVIATYCFFGKQEVLKYVHVELVYCLCVNLFCLLFYLCLNVPVCGFSITRTLYNFADTKKKGEITHGQFVSLLNVLNPYDKIRFGKLELQIRIALSVYENMLICFLYYNN